MAVLLTGCSSGSSGTVSPTPPTSPAAHRPAAMTIDQQVESIAIQSSDLASNQERRLIPGGNQVAGEVTLDNCGYDFTTEAYRVARREYMVIDDITGQRDIGNEVVAYDTPAHAAKALQQWYTAAAHCPKSTFRSAVAGEPPLKATIATNRRNVANLPTKPNVYTKEREAAKNIAVYASARLQLHGRILDVVYVTSPTPANKVVDGEAVQLAQATGRRLSDAN